MVLRKLYILKNNPILRQILNVVIISFFVSCEKKKEEYIQIVIQPDLVVNETVDFEIYFKEIPDQGSLKIESSDIFELNESPHTSINSVDNETKRHFYITYITPLREGNLKIPKISAEFNGIEHTTSLMMVVSKKVVDIKDNAVVLELKSNKKKYRLQDTVEINLFEYSKFDQIYKSVLVDTTKYTLPKMKGVYGNLTIEVETNFFKETGIKGLDDYLVDNFELIDYDWDPFKEMATMERKGNDMYIKNLLMKLVLIPKNKGEFSINKSVFKYKIYRSNDKYFNQSVPSENTTDSSSDKGVTKTIVKSNPLNFIVE